MLGVPGCLCSSLILFRYFSLHCLLLCNENNPFFLLWGFKWIISLKFSWYLFHLWGTCWCNKECTQRMSAAWRAEWDVSSLYFLWCFLRLHTASKVLCLEKYLRLASRSINTCTLWRGNICEYIIFELILTQGVRGMCTRIFPKNFLITIVLCRL